MSRGRQTSTTTAPHTTASRGLVALTQANQLITRVTVSIVDELIHKRFIGLALYWRYSGQRDYYFFNVTALMRHYSRLVGVASVLVLASAFVIAPLTAGAFWDGFPFGKPGIGSGSSSGIQTGPVTLCPRTITAAGISVNVFIPNKRGCDTQPPPPPPPPVDECPNVPGTQAEGPCADEECVEDGGTWDGDSCEFPEPEEPTLDFSATPPTIQQGASSTLEWDSDNADTCTASDGWSGTKSLDGSQIVDKVHITLVK